MIKKLAALFLFWSFRTARTRFAEDIIPQMARPYRIISLRKPNNSHFWTTCEL